MQNVHNHIHRITFTDCLKWRRDYSRRIVLWSTLHNGRTELSERGGLQHGALLATQDEKQSVPDKSAPGCHDAGHNPEGRLTLKQTEKGRETSH